MNIKWYYRDAALVIAFLILGFLMLPLVWFNPKFNLKSKLFWTAVILVLTYVFVKPIIGAYIIPKDDLLLLDFLTK